jgi:hypothetical protein
MQFDEYSVIESGLNTRSLYSKGEDQGEGLLTFVEREVLGGGYGNLWLL